MNRLSAPHFLSAVALLLHQRLNGTKSSTASQVGIYRFRQDPAPAPLNPNCR